MGLKNLDILDKISVTNYYPGFDAVQVWLGAIFKQSIISWCKASYIGFFTDVINFKGQITKNVTS